MTGLMTRQGAADRPAPPNAAEALRSLARFAAHRAAGNPQAALYAASDACHAAPHLPQPHYAYGEAWLALGDAARAQQAFAAAVQRAPAWPDAWINLGIASYRLGKLEDAKTAMRRALQDAPDHPVATSNLGAFLRITGESEAAETLLRDALGRAPGMMGVRLNLVADLLQEQRPAEALSLLEAAPRRPDEPHSLRHWHLQYSLALLQLGRVQEAQAVLDALTAMGPMPPELAPLLHWRRVLVAQSERDWPAARKQAEQMALALNGMGAKAVPEHRIMGHYDLARFWSGQSQGDAAFTHWQAGHRELRQSQPFSRPAYRAFIDANIELLDRARFTAGPRAGNTDQAPVFIVGMPRSGTTLCEQILAAHGQVHGAGERTALGQAFTTLGGLGDSTEALRRITALDAAALDAGAARFLADLHALAPDKARIVDKMPGNFLYLGLIGLLLPGARIIHCVRDPRDIGLSIFTFRFYGSHAYAHDLGDLGWAIAEQTRLMAHWQAALPNKVLTLRLDDWVGDFDATLARVLSHLDLPHDPNCARFHEAQSRVRTVSRTQVRQPVNARGLGRWRTYATQLAPLIAELEQAGALAGWQAPAPADA